MGKKEPKVEVIASTGTVFQRCKVLSATGELLGFVEKYADTATEQHPWKVFRPRFVAGSPAQFGEMVDAIYGSRAQAVARLT